MPKLRPLRKQEDLEKVPLTQEVLVETAPEPEEKQGDEVEVQEKVPVVKEPVVKEPEPDDEKTVLAKRVAELEKAEEIARNARLAAERQRDEALRHSQQREQEARVARGDAETAQYDAVVNAIGAAQSEAEAAQRDYENAMNAGDFKVAGEAQRRIARSESRLERLEEGKAAYEARVESARMAPRQEPVRQQPSGIDAQLDAMPLSQKQREWLKAHSEALTDPKKNARLSAAHFDAEDAGHAADSDAYFQFIEERLGYRKPAPNPSTPFEKTSGSQEEPEDEPKPEPQRRSVPVSAPVSRDNVSVSTGRPTASQVHLTVEEREAARISGVTDKVYAEQKLRLIQAKKEGRYQERG